MLRARRMAQSTARTTRSSSLDRAAAKPRKGTRPATAKAAPAKAVAAKAKAAPARSASTSSTLRPLKGGASVKPTSSAPVTPVTPPEPPRVVSTIIARGYVPLVDIPPLPPAPKNIKLEVGDKCVHPKHGLGEVTAIEQREIAGMKGEFFILRILDNGMRVMVPRSSAQAAGLRPVMSSKEADKVLETMRAREVAVDLQPWSRRFRAYTEMIKSGSPNEVAKVLRDMYRLKFDKDLSFGERRLLDQAKSLLMKELAAAKRIAEASLQATVDEMFRA
jgi:CarD family transcriptional regulator